MFWEPPHLWWRGWVTFRMSRGMGGGLGGPRFLGRTSGEILKSARYTMGRKTALRSAYPPRRLFRYESWVMKASHAAACCAGVYVVLPTVNGTKFISRVLRGT